MRGLLVGVVLGIAGGLLAVAPAQAAKVGYVENPRFGDRVTYVAQPGEQNDLAVSRFDSRVQGLRAPPVVVTLADGLVRMTTAGDAVTALHCVTLVGLSTCHNLHPPPGLAIDQLLDLAEGIFAVEVELGDGNDRVNMGGLGPHAPLAFLSGGAGDDVLIGGPAGLDELKGDAGDDELNGGPGADKIECGAGNDTVFADEQDSVSPDCETVIPSQPLP